MLVLEKATDLITATEAGVILGMSSSAISTFGRAGALKRISPSGRCGVGVQQMYFRDEVEQLARDRKSRKTSRNS